MKFSMALTLGSLVVAVSAMTCTEGSSWTPEEFQEYLTLNDTTGWAPMERIKHCTIEEGDLATRAELDARGGANQYVAYASNGCSNNVMFSVNNFGCGGCYSVGQYIKSGWLWRQTTGNPYPTVDYYPSTNCQGGRLHHQGILSGQYSSCNSVDGQNAASVVVYQGC